MKNFNNYQDVTQGVLSPKELQAIEWTKIVILKSDLGKNMISFENADLSAIKAKWEKATKEIFSKIPDITNDVITKDWKKIGYFEIKNNLKPESYFAQAA